MFILQAASGHAAMWSPTNPTEFWAMVTGAGTLALVIATLVLAIVAYRGLDSLKLTKDDIDTRNKREARVFAVARCEEFARTIIPLAQPFLSAMSRDQTPVFVKDASAVRFEGITEKDIERAGNWVQKAPPEVRAGIHQLFNALEAWSMYFTSQLADSALAYEPVGTVFCSMVIQYYPFLLLLRSSKGSGNYSNLVALYKEWTVVGSEKERAARYQFLLNQVAEIQKQGPAGERLAKPFGYET